MTKRWNGRSRPTQSSIPENTSSDGKRVAARRAAEGRSAGPHVIARIPKVTRERAAETVPMHEPRVARNLLPTWLSARLIVGTVILVMIVAAATSVPRMLGGKSHSSDPNSPETAYRPLPPAPDAPPAPLWNPSPADPAMRQQIGAPSVVPSTEYSPRSSVASNPASWGTAEPFDGPTTIGSSAGWSPHARA